MLSIEILMAKYWGITSPSVSVRRDRGDCAPVSFLEPKQSHECLACNLVPKMFADLYDQEELVPININQCSEVQL